VKQLCSCLVLVLGAAFLTALSRSAAEGPPRALGDIPVPPAVYQAMLLRMPVLEKEQTRAYLDYRDLGFVTPAKDQGVCGSCWAFASTAAFESRIIMAGGPSEVHDLSEQLLTSCETNDQGCCGGDWHYAFQFYQTHQPVLESCYAYGDGSSSCDSFPSCPPDCSSVACSYACPTLSWEVVNAYSVDATDPNQVISALVNYGPGYFRFDVYTDFDTYWYGSPGIYRHTGGTYRGGHAVEIIGYDSDQRFWICKNSWGENQGPFGDGTFRIAWTGHSTDLNFGMAVITVTSPAGGLLPSSTPAGTALLVAGMTALLRARRRRST
jgi:C1A family cysteine protease